MNALMQSANRFSVLYLIIPASLAVLGNVLNLPLFYGVDFIFGSIAVMLSIALFGTGHATVAALAGGMYTLFLWGHPYAMIIFTAEALCVGWFYQRGHRNLVLVDVAYWLLLGVPLVLVCYGQVLAMSWESTLLIALKQSLNGVFNAIIAGLIFLSLQLSDKGRQWKLPPATLSVLLFQVLLMTVLAAGFSPILYESYQQRIVQERFLADKLYWQANTIAANLEDQSPNLTEADRLRISIPKHDSSLAVGLLGPDDAVLASQGALFSLGREQGDVEILENGLSIWLPGGEMPEMQRWKQGRYTIRVAVNTEQRLVLEHSAVPLVRKLEQGRLSLFSLLAVLTFAGTALARALSRWLSQPLSKLAAAGHYMSDKIFAGEKPNIPAGKIYEHVHLSNTLTDMASKLSQSFTQLQTMNSDLEEEVKHRTRELRESQERWRFALEGTGDGVWDWDIVNDQVFYSTQWKRMLGYAKNGIGNDMQQWQSRLHPEDKSTALEAFEKHLCGETDYYESEHRLRCKNGDYLWVLSRGKVILRNIDGTPQRVIGTLSNISERKNNEERLLIAINDAEKANMAKSDFLSNMSHELRTPLNSIIGFTGIIRSGMAGPTNEIQNKQLKMVDDSARHLLELINNILDLSKIEAGKSQVEWSRFNVWELLDDTMEQVKVLYVEKGLDLQTESRQEIIEIRSDRQKLYQILLNLLSNALKFTEQGGVSVSCKTRNKDLVIEVKDTGIGIPEKHLSLIFDAFQQGDSGDSRMHEGTGLGLAISQKFTQMLNGHISITSRVGEGSCFTVLLKDCLQTPVYGDGSVMEPAL
ncbi:MAG: PAS domain-containing sensor histidine kinase [Gammaproteobacteria bacterium]|nr:PAS domain-containing sensor histidine kinase [Gammaproteobacteria bacterium]MDH5800144.1 PAS domain-containing sensor histidine kinase [Gammaproteobacteria bacterium]